MNRRNFGLSIVGLAIVVSIVGCQSPYRADQGALLGGLLGAGTGAIIGDAVGGKAGPGAAIGAGLGAIGGAAVGSELDEIEAQNRAMIEQQLGQRVAAGAVRLDQVVTMTQAGVDDELIVNHIRAHGVARPLQTDDLIFLQQQGVSTKVIKAMQEPPPPPARPVVIHQPAPPPVVVHEYSYGPPLWGPACYPSHHHWRRRPRSRVSWGMSFHN
ncbi:MAG: glycine zipper domain-containing protein [Planctomycetota bacterium]|jgi:uncharacterized protein YcfJ